MAASTVVVANLTLHDLVVNPEPSPSCSLPRLQAIRELARLPHATILPDTLPTVTLDLAKLLCHALRYLDRTRPYPFAPPPPPPTPPRCTATAHSTNDR